MSITETPDREEIDGDDIAIEEVSREQLSKLKINLRDADFDIKDDKVVIHGTLFDLVARDVEEGIVAEGVTLYIDEKTRFPIFTESLDLSGSKLLSEISLNIINSRIRTLDELKEVMEEI